MSLQSKEAQGRLAGFLAAQSGARSVEISSAARLFGGAVQDNWRLEVEIDGGALAGAGELALRTDALTGLAASRNRAEEFALLRVAFDAGVPVPKPLYLCEDVRVIGRRFLVTQWVPGIANGSILVRDPAWEGRRRMLCEQLGRALARIHAIRPPRVELEFLGAPAADPATARLILYRRWLDQFDDPHPVAEWALRWLARETPEPAPAALCHGDFRTGNFLANDEGLAAVLDWEFAAWGDPHEDIGWFCSKSWRFGAFEREAGGLAERAVFYRGYQDGGGTAVDPARVHYWEIMASLRWFILALQQRDRFIKGGESSLDLALTGRRSAECAFEMLRLIEVPPGRAA